MKLKFGKQVYLDDVKSNREYFLLHDGLHNFASELNYSVLPKYVCKAKCEKCYAKHMWENADIYPDTPLETEEIAIFESVSKMFKAVGTIDDLFNLSLYYPNAYHFYKEHAGTMQMSSATDNAFIRMYGILMSEMDFDKIYEVSFSADFLNRSPAVITNVMRMLNDLISKYELIQVKLIVSSDNIKSDAISTVAKWCHDNSIQTILYNDITTQSNDETLDEFGIGSAHQVKKYLIDNDKPYMLLNQSLYAQRNDVYLTIEDSIKLSKNPFYVFTKETAVDVDELLYSLLNAKIEKYKEYAEEITLTDTRYYEYFSWVADNVTAIRNFNFIPIMFIPENSAITVYMMNNCGYVKTAAGYLKVSDDGTWPDTIKPIVSIKS